MPTCFTPIDQSLAAVDLDDERTLYLGPDHAANLVGVVVLMNEGEDQPVVIHAIAHATAVPPVASLSRQEEDANDS